jgi:hypothetical protein
MVGLIAATVPSRRISRHSFRLAGASNRGQPRLRR